NKYTNICILPYVIENNILSKIGVINDFNFVRNKNIPTLLTGIKNSDNISDMDSANDLLIKYSNININNATNWMFLGDLFSNKLSDSSIKLYCVDVSDKLDEFIKNKSNFYFINVEESILSDDMLLLSGYLRLFNLFYAQHINK
ncbi:MAG: hypothetical protein RSC92_05810, partial [Clostridia bacterium]